MKRVLIISPHFPPVNAPDMQRVRMSLPYFNKLGWEAVVICVNEKYVEGYLDPLLNKTIPGSIVVHKVKAFPVNITRKIGLGSLSMRSYWYFKKKGNELLRGQKFDLVYFSTTAFHVCRLGPYWKSKFNVPFVVDLQDPWRSDFYLDKPKSERPPKFALSYKIDKFLEKETFPNANGFISVSSGYRDVLLERYPNLTLEQFRVITFGATWYDMEIMQKYVHNTSIHLPANKKNLVYIGRGGYDMQYALKIIFAAFRKGLVFHPEIFLNAHFSFIGTSYAIAGTGYKTVEPLAIEEGLDKYVTEITERIPYFETLYLLGQADILIIPGSTDKMYTASKLYPYLMAEKPVLAIFSKESSVISVLNDLQIGRVVKFDEVNSFEVYVEETFLHLKSLLMNLDSNITMDMGKFKKYTAEAKTSEQVDFFNELISK